MKRPYAHWSATLRTWSSRTGWFTRTIYRQLLGSFFFIFLATYLATALVVLGATRTAVVRAERDTLAQLAHNKLNNLNTRFDQLAINLRAWSKLDVMNDLTSGDVDKRVQRALENLKGDYSLQGDLYAFDAAGRLVASSDQRHGEAALPDIWKRKGQRGFVDKHANPIGTGEVVALSMPVTLAMPPGYPLGTLVLAYPWSAVQAALSGQTLLLRKQEQPLLLASSLNPAETTEALAAFSGADTDGWARIGGKRYLANSAQNEEGLLSGWQIIAMREPISLDHTLNVVALELAALCALLAIPLTLAIRWLAQRLTAPLSELTRFVAGITETADLTQRITLSANDEIGTLATAFNHMATKLDSSAWEREIFVRKLEIAGEQLNDAYQDAVTMLSVACEGKDEDTAFHGQRVQHLTEALALEIGKEKEEAHHLGVMSLLHDVGKMSIPDAILKKPGKLTPDEWAVMQTHAELGVRILGDNPFYAVARDVAGSHHENWDGSGYPYKLANEAIPLAGRIVKVADVFDALTSRRPYKEPWAVERALELLRQESGKQFDPDVVDAFLRLHASGAITRILIEFQG